MYPCQMDQSHPTTKIVVNICPRPANIDAQFIFSSKHDDISVPEPGKNMLTMKSVRAILVFSTLGTISPLSYAS